MPALNTISIKGFKSIVSIEKLKLGAINVVIGPNGSGKSNFIGVFSFLHAIREGRLQDYVVKAGGADKVLHFGAKVTKQLHIHISFLDETNQYEINLEPTSMDELVPQSEWTYYWNKSKFSGPMNEGLPRVGKEAGISAQEYTKIARYVRDHLDRWRLYHFHDTSSTSPMKMTADVNDNRYLRSDGSNIWLHFFTICARSKTTLTASSAVPCSA